MARIHGSAKSQNDIDKYMFTSFFPQIIADSKYINLSGSVANNNDDPTNRANGNVNVATVIPANGQIRNLSIAGDVVPGTSNAIALTIIKNGTPTALTVTLGATDLYKQSVGNFIAVAAGDLICAKQTVTGSPDTSNITCSLEFVKT